MEAGHDGGWSKIVMLKEFGSDVAGLDHMMWCGQILKLLGTLANGAIEESCAQPAEG